MSQIILLTYLKYSYPRWHPVLPCHQIIFLFFYYLSKPICFFPTRWATWPLNDLVEPLTTSAQPRPPSLEPQCAGCQRSAQQAPASPGKLFAAPAKWASWLPALGPAGPEPSEIAPSQAAQRNGCQNAKKGVGARGLEITSSWFLSSEPTTTPHKLVCCEAHFILYIII